MLRIDGSYGEGGGQILRTSLAFSALTRTPIKIHSIRHGRKTPGLRPQHLKGCEAVRDICGGDAGGLHVGSEEITLTPNEIGSDIFEIDIQTAGSVTLLLQAVLPVALCAPEPVSFKVVGGTDVKWSPPADYFRDIFLKYLEKIGCDVRFKIIKRGYYPKGGGVVELECRPWTGKKSFDFGDTVDEYLADQLVPYLALGGGSYRATSISAHTRTNVWVANQFGFELKIEGDEIINNKSNKIPRHDGRGIACKVDGTYRLCNNGEL